jgi:hypothetical protein
MRTGRLLFDLLRLNGEPLVTSLLESVCCHKYATRPPTQLFESRQSSRYSYLPVQQHIYTNTKIYCSVFRHLYHSNTWKNAVTSIPNRLDADSVPPAFKPYHPRTSTTAGASTSSSPGPVTLLPNRHGADTAPPTLTSALSAPPLVRTTSAQTNPDPSSGVPATTSSPKTHGSASRN